MSLGLYIHIPFCINKCNYCHFLTTPWHGSTAERYSKALIGELKIFFSTRPCNEEIDSIYFGGGTPSAVPAEHIAEILAACRQLLPLPEDCEVSLEANPETLSAEKLAVYYETGVNRISVGAQSFDDRELASIGRVHESHAVETSLKRSFEAGFENINLDMMLGLPGQKAETWMDSLERAVHFAPAHLSIYMLDLEEKCQLSTSVAEGQIHVPDEELVSDLYLNTVDFLLSRGYGQYEISNFAARGHVCRHNLKYWTREPVYGFGLGSHSFDGNLRSANCSNMDDYFQAVEAGRRPVEWLEPVAEEQALEETLFLGLRLKEGLDWSHLQQKYTVKRLAEYEGLLRDMSGQGLLEWEKSTVRLTPLGMLLSNEIFQQFV